MILKTRRSFGNPVCWSWSYRSRILDIVALVGLIGYRRTFVGLDIVPDRMAEIKNETTDEEASLHIDDMYQYM